jgi:hypothetical protein
MSKLDPDHDLPNGAYRPKALGLTVPPRDERPCNVTIQQNTGHRSIGIDNFTIDIWVFLKALF